MQQQSLKRHEIDWAAFRAHVLQKAQGAQTTADTYEAIRFAIGKLNDGHSFLVTPGGDGSGWVSASTPEDLTSRLLEGRFGYLLLPSFAGRDSFNPASAAAFAARVQEAVARQDSAGACGWVIDLRFNSGGNMWPMLAGVGEVLGAGEVGGFLGSGGSHVPWIYAWGSAGTPGNRAVTVDPTARLGQSQPPAAVLTSGKTSSAGEALVTAFRGRPSARAFGTATQGASTANQAIWLGDGAMLFLTVAIYADRVGQVYGGPLEPDVEIVGGADSPGQPLDSDPVVASALRWLSEQAACSE